MEAATVTDEQWEAAREEYYKQLPVECGLPHDKYNTILDLLENWDARDPAERRRFASGNQAYWKKNYIIMRHEDGTKELLHLKKHNNTEDRNAPFDMTNYRKTSHVDRMFEDIKAIHVEGARIRLRLLPFPRLCTPFMFSAACIMCLSAPVCRVFAAQHAKDVTLHKRVELVFGRSIPRSACQLFGKVCPICIRQIVRAPKAAGFKPILTEGFGERGQVHCMLIPCTHMHGMPCVLTACADVCSCSCAVHSWT